MKANITAAWQGNFREGLGNYRRENSALNAINFKHFASKNTAAATDPEELLGAAHAACFNMTMLYILEQAGYTAQELETSAAITISNNKVTHSDLVLVAKVDDIEPGQLNILAEKAKELCTIGQALNPDIQISLEVILKSE